MSRFILAWMLFAAASAAQDGATSPPAKLQIRPPTVGDRTEIKIESNVELNIVTKGMQEGDAEVVRQVTYVRTMECMQTVEAGAEGAAPNLRVLVATAKLQKSGTNIAPVTETSEIEAKTYIVSRNDKGRTVKADNGDPAPGDAVALGAWEDFAELLPAGEPKEGATWTIDAAAISAIVTIPDLPAPTGTFDAKMESMADGKAVVFFSGTLTGKTAKGFNTTLKIAKGASSSTRRRAAPRCSPSPARSRPPRRSSRRSAAEGTAAGGGAGGGRQGHQPEARSEGRVQVGRFKLPASSPTAATSPRVECSPPRVAPRPHPRNRCA
jgi:hypothetical protein